MLSAFTNCLKIPELRQKIFFTLALLFIARVGANIPLPGMNPAPIQEYLSNEARLQVADCLGFIIFYRWCLVKWSTVRPWYHALHQCLDYHAIDGCGFPGHCPSQQEGDVGRQKINQYTRYLTIAICLVQGLMLLVAFSTNPGSIIPGFNPVVYGEVV